MATITWVYGAKVTMTITLAALAQDATNLVAGRQSTVVDNKDVDQGVDAMLGGLVTVGATVSSGKQIEVWLFGSFDDAASGGFSGSALATDGNFTPDEKTNLQLFTIIPINGTANKGYRFGPKSVAQAFGGVMPTQWGVYIVHNTGGSLHATAGNHRIEYIPVKLLST
jgi:hypothetical protein